MSEGLLIILGIITIIIGLIILYSMPSAFLKEFEKQCYEIIKEKDKKIEEEELNRKELRKWLFKHNR